MTIQRSAGTKLKVPLFSFFSSCFKSCEPHWESAPVYDEGNNVIHPKNKRPLTPALKTAYKNGGEDAVIKEFTGPTLR